MIDIAVEFVCVLVLIYKYKEGRSENKVGYENTGF